MVCRYRYQLLFFYASIQVFFQKCWLLTQTFVLLNSCLAEIPSTVRRPSRSWLKPAVTPAFTFTYWTWACPEQSLPSHREASNTLWRVRTVALKAGVYNYIFHSKVPFPPIYLGNLFLFSLIKRIVYILFLIFHVSPSLGGN